jgi:hypothetical protein
MRRCGAHRRAAMWLSGVSECERSEARGVKDIRRARTIMLGEVLAPNICHLRPFLIWTEVSNISQNFSQNNSHWIYTAVIS